MGLPTITAEFGVVKEPELRFSENGSAWMRVRCKASKDIRGADGTWTKGKPLFIDVVVGSKYATNLAESIANGDTIIVHGELEPNEWTDKEGNTHSEIRVRADYVGVSVKWQAARTPNVSKPADDVASVAASLGATIIESAPF